MYTDDKPTIPTGYVVKECLREYGHSLDDIYDNTELDDEYLDDFFEGRDACTLELLDKLVDLMPNIPRSYWIAYDITYMFQKHLTT